MVERSKLLGCSCWQAGWLALWRGAGWVGTRRLREVAPPSFASSHTQPVVCLLCYVESACSPQCCQTLLLSSPFVSASSWSSSLSFLLFSAIFTPTLFIFLSTLSSLPVPAPSSSSVLSVPPVQAHAPHPPPHRPVARIMTLLTTQTHGGSGYGPAKSSHSLTSITSLAPLSSLGRVGETEGWRGCSAVCRLRVDCMLRCVTSSASAYSGSQGIFYKWFRGHTGCFFFLNTFKRKWVSTVFNSWREPPSRKMWSSGFILCLFEGVGSYTVHWH